MDNLLHVLHSDGADELRLRVGEPPMVVLEGEEQPIEGPQLTTEDTEQLFQSVADTRHRRQLRDHGRVEFIYRFRDRASFVVDAKMDHGNVQIYVH